MKTFTLRSGAVLEVGAAEFEKGVALVEAVAASVIGQNPDLQMDHVVLFNPAVRRAIYEVFPWVVYDKARVTPDLFNDAKLGVRACSDWFEMAARIVEVNREHFFPKTSSGSSVPGEALTKGQA